MSGDITSGDTLYEEPRTLSEAEKSLLASQKEMGDFKRRKLEIEAQKNWDRFYKRNKGKFFKDRHWTKNEITDILCDVNLENDLIFCEAGCGVGNMLFPLAEYFPHWSFFGFDFSANAVEEVRKRAEEQQLEVTVNTLDLTDSTTLLSFPEADLVTLIFVLSAIHPDKHDQVVKNLKNYIKVGGSLFFRDYGALDYAMIRFGRDAKIGERFYARQDGTRAFYFYKEEVIEWFEKNGFELKRAEYLHKNTTNHEKGLSVDRVFLQARFIRTS